MTTTRATVTGFGGLALLLATLWAVNVYRASTQSITYDEAVTYDAFVAGPMTSAFTRYNANNHVLFTVAAKLTTRVLGTSELSLRLPSVAAGALYFAVVFWLGRLLFGAGAIFFLAVAALALNPLVLDFLSAARGYGPAVALFLVAFHQITFILLRRQHDQGGDERRRWMAASLALAGSVSSNLTFLFPAVALGIAALALAASDAPRPFSRLGLVWVARTIVVPLVGPGLLVTGALLAVPLSRAERDNFTYGADRLGGMVASLVDASIHHHPSGWRLDRLARAVAGIEATVLVPLTMAALLATSAVVAARAIGAWSVSRPTAEDRLLWLITITLAVTIAELVAVHQVWSVPYPRDRTGLYFVPLFVLALAFVGHRADVWQRGAPAIRAFAVAWLAILVGQSVSQFTVTHYAMWRFDAGTRTVFEITTRWPAPERDASIRIAASWLLRPSLEYYRLADVTARVRSVSEGVAANQVDGFDFAIVSDSVRGDMELVRDAAELVCVHSLSGAMLFVNHGMAAARWPGAIDRATRPGECDSVLSTLQRVHPAGITPGAFK